MAIYESDSGAQEYLGLYKELVNRALGGLGLTSTEREDREAKEAQAFLRSRLPLALPEGAFFRVMPAEPEYALSLTVQSVSGQIRQKLIVSGDRISELEFMEPETISRDEQKQPIFKGDMLDIDPELTHRFAVVSAGRYIWALCNPYLNSTQLIIE